MLVDSHCHLDFPDLIQNEADMLARMADNGVTHALCVAVKLETLAGVIGAAERHPNVFASVGVHPDNADCEEPDEARLLALAAHPKVVAIEIPMPDLAARKRVIGFLAPKLSEQQLTLFSERTGGLRTVQLASIMASSEGQGLSETQRRALILQLLAGTPDAESRANTLATITAGMTPDEITRLTDLSVKCCERVRDAVKLLSRIADPAVAEAALKTCEEIDRLEGDADRVLRSAMSKLFREETDVRELIKLKAIYELLETITDKCEDVANLIEGVILENS